MLVVPITRINHRHLDHLGRLCGCKIVRMADHDDVGIALHHAHHVTQTLGVVVADAGGLGVGKPDDRPSQSDHGAFEADLGAGTDLEESQAQDFVLQEINAASRSHDLSHLQSEFEELLKIGAPDPLEGNQVPSLKPIHPSGPPVRHRPEILGASRGSDQSWQFKTILPLMAEASIS
jgi:hypothetical protein